MDIEKLRKELLKLDATVQNALEDLELKLSDIEDRLRQLEEK